jgi:hypothetical protein
MLRCAVRSGCVVHCNVPPSGVRPGVRYIRMDRANVLPRWNVQVGVRRVQDVHCNALITSRCTGRCAVHSGVRYTQVCGTLRCAARSGCTLQCIDHFKVYGQVCGTLRLYSALSRLTLTRTGRCAVRCGCGTVQAEANGSWGCHGAV